MILIKYQNELKIFGTFRKRHISVKLKTSAVNAISN